MKVARQNKFNREARNYEVKNVNTDERLKRGVYKEIENNSLENCEQGNYIEQNRDEGKSKAITEEEDRDDYNVICEEDHNHDDNKAESESGEVKEDCEDVEEESSKVERRDDKCVILESEEGDELSEVSDDKKSYHLHIDGRMCSSDQEIDA